MKLETLIIDDDKIICFLHKKLCDLNGLTPSRIFSAAEEALAYLQDNDDPGRQFLLLLDINMPVMNGWDMLEALKTAGISSPVDVMMVTSSIDEADLKKSMSYKQVCGFVSKPLNPEKLQEIHQRSAFITLR